MSAPRLPAALAGALGLYVLDGSGTPIRCADIIAWGTWMGAHLRERTIGKTRVGDALVSTVFLGIDHAFLGGAPRLYETMIFGGVSDRVCERCSTLAEATAQHARWVALHRDRKPID